MRRARVKAVATRLGMVVNVRDSKAFAGYLAGEMKKWADVVRIAGVKPE